MLRAGRYPTSTPGTLYSNQGSDRGRSPARMAKRVRHCRRSTVSVSV